MKKPKIVVLGAGYGGLMAITRLQKILGAHEAELTLVNKNEYHYEATWLHEAAAGTLHHERLRYPIKDVINTQKVEFIQDTVVSIDEKEKKIVLEKGELTYDYLVIALGFESETFGIQGMTEHAFSITSIDTVRRIREHIDFQFSSYKAEGKTEDINIIVGGGGFTGIEFLGELVHRIPKLCKEYDIPREKVHIINVEHSPTILPGFDPKLVEYATDYLMKKGVEFTLGAEIREAFPGGIKIKKNDEEITISASTVVWAAGVRGSHIIDESNFESGRGRVKVDEFLRAPGHSDVFIIGDCSLVINPDTDRPYPPTAQISMQQGEQVAKNIAKTIRGLKTDLTPFVYSDKGTVCSLGDKDGVGVVFGKKITGTQASFMKKVIDNRALFLIGGFGLLFKKGKFNFF